MVPTGNERNDKMSISKIKIAWKYLTGGMGAVADYLLDIVNSALAKIDPANRAKIAAAYNTINHVLATLTVLQWLCPTKWQNAYNVTLAAVEAVVDALEDMKIEPAELTKVKDTFAAAVTAWRSGDVPDTDVDFKHIEDCAEDKWL